MDYQVSAITKRILLGPFLSPQRAAYLSTLGVSHVLNVSDAPSVVPSTDYGFATIVDIPLADWTHITNETAVACVDALHGMLTSSGSKVYVHCIAGQNRSATVVWLYLIANGLTATAAKTLVEQAARDAVPGHKALVDDRLTALIADYGRRSLTPLSDPTALEPG